MRPKLPVTRYVRNHLMRIALLTGLALTCAMPAGAQSGKASLPDPVKFLFKYDIVGNVVYSVLNDMGFRIELDDRKGGRIVTRPYEFISGSLTASEVDKVAIKKDTLTGSWLKARYSVEAVLEIVSPAETMVTIRTDMEALQREIDGTEKWVPINSRGIIERRILGRISNGLLHNDSPVEERKGFWGQRPQPVDPRQPRFPRPPSR